MNNTTGYYVPCGCCIHLLLGNRIEVFMKVFISQKMSGLTEEEVMETRNKAIAHLKSVYGDNIEVIENYYHENAPADASRIWHLGESIKMLEKADMVYFCDDSKDSNGCIIERTICELYNIPIYDTTATS